MSQELLTKLADYSRQPLLVGTPPRLLFNEAGQPQDRELVVLSVQLRIAEALERTEGLGEASRWILVETALPPARPGNAASWAVLAVEYTGSQVLVSYNWSTGQWDGLDYKPRITHWQPLPKGPMHQEGGQGNG